MYFIGCCLIFMGMIIGRIAARAHVVRMGYVDYEGIRYSVKRNMRLD